MTSPTRAYLGTGIWNSESNLKQKAPAERGGHRLDHFLLRSDLCSCFCTATLGGLPNPKTLCSCFLWRPFPCRPYHWRAYTQGSDRTITNEPVQPRHGRCWAGRLEGGGRFPRIVRPLTPYREGLHPIGCIIVPRKQSCLDQVIQSRSANDEGPTGIIKSTVLTSLWINSNLLDGWRSHRNASQVPCPEEQQCVAVPVTKFLNVQRPDAEETRASFAREDHGASRT